ncbi:hypothetical protein BO94DRAFT_537516 [Aspergillus sclerotioniger CBS 115572]|uniref:Uncharacterized protein n=1 Tax=Aspergillus sclerotioniger CBS 115572 TaxID=1450535 RepID=A0A317W0G9_9EURO|nr:hypothetical protein BO94DRAFT_537516 [Aspergillus sclerotioniger CBS 115572]PWY79485.1 hypothetical protein BO94DRAFT_537516 [Aspergillus sclerotioniger CBS 115572]
MARPFVLGFGAAALICLPVNLLQPAYKATSRNVTRQLGCCRLIWILSSSFSSFPPSLEGVSEELTQEAK